MGEKPLQNLNSWQSNFLRGLVWVHCLLAAVFIPLAIYGSLFMMKKHPAMFTDFTVPFAAAKILASSPEDLYRPSAYNDFYAALKSLYFPSIHFKDVSALRLLYSPMVPILLWPLHFFNYTHAYIAWSALNILFCILIARKIGQLALICGLQQLKAFFQSCIAGLVVTAHIFYMGQISLLLCLFFTGFLVALSQRNIGKAALWFVGLLLIKPHLFIFIPLYFLGCRQWRFSLYIASLYLSFFFLSACVTGFGPWMDYMRIFFIKNPMDKVKISDSVIISLRGVLSSGGGELLYSYLFTPANCLWCIQFRSSGMGLHFPPNTKL